ALDVVVGIGEIVSSHRVGRRLQRRFLTLLVADSKRDRTYSRRVAALIDDRDGKIAVLCPTEALDRKSGAVTLAFDAPQGTREDRDEDSRECLEQVPCVGCKEIEECHMGRAAGLRMNSLLLDGPLDLVEGDSLATDLKGNVVALLHIQGLQGLGRGRSHLGNPPSHPNDQQHPHCQRLTRLPALIVAVTMIRTLIVNGFVAALALTQVGFATADNTCAHNNDHVYELATSNTVHSDLYQGLFGFLSNTDNGLTGKSEGIRQDFSVRVYTSARDCGSGTDTDFTGEYDTGIGGGF